MNTEWPMIPLGEVLRLRSPDTQVDLTQHYRFAGVYSFGRGVFIGQERSGSTFSYRSLTRLRSNEFVYPKLMAWEGAFGVVPEVCGGCYVSPEFAVFEIDQTRLIPSFLQLFFSTPKNWKRISGGSMGTNVRRKRLYPDQLFREVMPLPALDEQRRIVARIDGVATRVQEVKALRARQQDEAKRLLASAFDKIAVGAPRVKMHEIAPLVRRPVEISFEATYPELGVRSFFKGTFSKPSLSALELGDKRVFWIEPGDLIFSNVFAWEGAIAIATPKDAHRVGSHRFMTCVPVTGIAEARFLLQYFQTDEGFGRIKDASPGGAGRNRTLGVEALANIDVPVPSIEKQSWFSGLHQKLENLFFEQKRIDVLYETMGPAVIEREFNAQTAAGGRLTDRQPGTSDKHERVVRQAAESALKQQHQ